MPAKAKVTKEMIVDAAFAIAREAGVERINARTVSERLHCSTQPIMYHFATMEALKRTVYAKADLYHSEYLMNTRKRAMPASTPPAPLIHEGVFLSPLLLYNVAMNILQQIFSDHYEEIKEPLT